MLSLIDFMILSNFSFEFDDSNMPKTIKIEVIPKDNAFNAVS